MVTWHFVIKILEQQLTVILRYAFYLLIYHRIIIFCKILPLVSCFIIQVREDQDTNLYLN